MSGKVITGLIVLSFLAGVTYLVVKNWDSIKGVFGKSGLKECKDLSPFDCVIKHGAKKTMAATAGDRYDYGDYGFYSNGRAVLIGTSPAKKGDYDKKEIKWDDGNKTSMKDVLK